MTSLTWTHLFTLTAPDNWPIIQKISSITNEISRNINGCHHCNTDINFKLNSDLKYIENTLNDIAYKQLFLYLLLDTDEERRLLERIGEIHALAQEIKSQKRTEFSVLKHKPTLIDIRSSDKIFFEHDEKFYYLEKNFENIEKINLKKCKYGNFSNFYEKKNIKHPDFFEKKLLKAEEKLKEAYHEKINLFLLAVFTLGLGMIAIKTYNFVSSFWTSRTNEESQKNLDKTNDKQQSI